METEQWTARIVLQVPHGTVKLGDDFLTDDAAQAACLRYVHEHYGKLGIDFTEDERGWFSHESVRVNGEPTTALILVRRTKEWKAIHGD